MEDIEAVAEGAAKVAVAVAMAEENTERIQTLEESVAVAEETADAALLEAEVARREAEVAKTEANTEAEIKTGGEDVKWQLLTESLRKLETVTEEIRDTLWALIAVLEVEEEPEPEAEPEAEVLNVEIPQPETMLERPRGMLSRLFLEPK